MDTEVSRKRRSRSGSNDSVKVSQAEEATPPPKRKKEELDPLLTRTGGAYIPPARLRMMQEAITDKSSSAYQRLTWEALKKSINGLVNKVNVSNISNIVRELFQENLVRGKGLFARSVIQAQGASPMFSHVYAALVAIINTKLPRIGELIIKRLMVRFKRSYSRKDKTVCIATVKFIAHLVNQHVLYELVALELLTLLLEEPTDDSVEVAVGFAKDCGLSLKATNSQALHTIFEMFRSILHSGKLTSRVQYMIEVLFAVRKDNFKDHPSVIEELDLVHEDDQHTHFVSLLEEDFDTEDKLNVFRYDPEYLDNEEAYKSIREEVLGEESEESGSEEDGEESEESEEESENEDNKLDITDETGTSELALRRHIYLTIMSSLDFEECAHKLLKTMKEGQEREVAFMLVECCSQERSYMRFYGMLGQRLCLLNQAWVAVFDEAFQEQYATVHRLETNKLRNVAKFFSQLFFVDALPWTSMACIHLNEEETNSSSRIFVKIVFQQLAEFMGLVRLNERLRDPMLADGFEGLLPRDNPKNTRFAINFFTSIGLGGLTDDLREHLKNAQKMIMAQKQEVSSDDSTTSSSSSSSSSSETSESDSDSSSSDEEERRQRHKRKTRKEKGGKRQKKGEDDGKRRTKKGEEDETRLGEGSKRRKKGKEDDSKRRNGEEDNRRKRRGEEEDGQRRRGEKDDKRKKRKEEDSSRRRKGEEGGDRRRRRDDEDDGRRREGEEDGDRKRRDEDHNRRSRYEGRDEGDERSDRRRNDEDDNRWRKEERRGKSEGDSRRKGEEEDGRRKKREEDDRRRRKGEEEDGRRKNRDEEDSRRKNRDEEDSRRRNRDEEDSRRRKGEEEDSRKKRDERDRRMRKEEDGFRNKSEASDRRRRDEDDDGGKRREDDSRRREGNDRRRRDDDYDKRRGRDEDDSGKRRSERRGASP